MGANRWLKKALEGKVGYTWAQIVGSRRHLKVRLVTHGRKSLAQEGTCDRPYENNFNGNPNKSLTNNKVDKWWWCMAPGGVV